MVHLDGDERNRARNGGDGAECCLRAPRAIFLRAPFGNNNNDDNGQE